MIVAAGLPEPNQPERIANTARALRLTAWAKDRGAALALHERLFRDYWAEARDLADDAVLLEAAAAVGLDREQAAPALDDPAQQEAVRSSTGTAVALGARGVPAFVIDRRLLVPGAQPHELFARVMERLGHEPVAGLGP